MRFSNLSSYGRPFTIKANFLNSKIAIHQRRQQTLFTARLWTGLFGVALLVASSFIESSVGLILACLILLVFFPFLVFLSRKNTEFLSQLQTLRHLLIDRTDQIRKGKLALEDPFLPSDPRAKTLGIDLDLFGKKSLMSLIDLTQFKESQAGLASWLAGGQQSLSDLKVVQDRVAALSKNGKVFHRHLLTLRNLQIPLVDLGAIHSFLKTPLTANSFFVLFLGAVGFWSASLFASLLPLSLPGSPSGGNEVWRVFQLLSSGFLGAYWLVFAVSIGTLTGAFQKALTLEAQMRPLLSYTKKLESLLIKARKNLLEDDPLMVSLRQNPVSSQVAALHFWTGFLSIQTHPLVFFGLNLIFPWSFIGTFFLERTRKKLSEGFEEKKISIARFDTFLSMSFFARLPFGLTYPAVGANPRLSFKSLSHPLIDHNSCVPNDFDFEKSQVLILSGSNMSGKSTFLRAIGLNQSLACAGLPVFATHLQTFLGEIQSCLRVSDSLDEGLSYFYAEVVRIAEILKRTENHSSLVLIDEIFKGTNNRERILAAQFIAQQLLTRDSLSILSTHDLELTELATQYPRIDNAHFSDRVEGDKMTFDYKIQKGPCTSTNALQILKRAGVQVPI